VVANVYQTISNMQLVEEHAFHFKKGKYNLKARATPAKVRLDKGMFAQSVLSWYPYHQACLVGP